MADLPQDRRALDRAAVGVRVPVRPGERDAEQEKAERVQRPETSAAGWGLSVAGLGRTRRSAPATDLARTIGAKHPDAVIALAQRARFKVVIIATAVRTWLDGRGLF